jgi:predicted NAD/FAD-dependent oxidoreductase
VVWAAPGCVVADLGEPVHAVGDCVAPRRVEHAVHEAHAVARVL